MNDRRRREMNSQRDVVAHRSVSEASGNRTGMDSNRRTALIAGILFIVATAASLLGTAIEQPVLTGTDYLTRISEHLTRVSAGGFFELVGAGPRATMRV